MTDLLPTTPELTELRAATRILTQNYGHKCFVDCATTHKAPVELYEELGAVLNFVAQRSLGLPPSY